MLDRPTDNPTAEPEPKGDVVYAFPSKSRCPICESVDTVRTGDHGLVQYRRCRGCGETYKVLGQKI